MKYTTILTALTFTLGLNLPAAHAEKEHMHEQHGAHEHGAAQLNIALEQPLLMLELRIPAMDIVGFGHAPHDDAQKSLIAQAEQQLMQAEEVFGINASAGCKLKNAQAKRVALNAEHAHHDEHDEDEHHDESDMHHDDEDEHAHHDEHEMHHHDEDAKDDDEHKHHDEHDEQGEKQADSEMHSDAEEHEAHAEFHSSYTFHCAKPADLSGIEVHLFNLYSSLRKVQVQAVTATGQSAPLLTPSHTHIRLP